MFFFFCVGFYTPLKSLQECERTDFKMNCVNEWPAEQLSVPPCLYLFIVCNMCCAATSCSNSLLKLSPRRLRSCSANYDGGCCCSSSHVQILISALPRLSAVCCPGCCLVFFLVELPCLSSPQLPVMSTLACFCLDKPCTSKSIPSPSLKIMIGCCDDDFLLSCASTSCLLRLWHPTLPCPVPIGDCPPMRCL